MRIPVIRQRFSAHGKVDGFVRRLGEAIESHNDIELSSLEEDEVRYAYCGELPLQETGGIIHKRFHNTIMARVSVQQNSPDLDIRFAILVDVVGLIGFVLFPLICFGVAAQIIRTIIWLTDDLADKISGAIIAPIAVGVGIWITRLLARRALREIRALRLPLQKTIQATAVSV